MKTQTIVTVASPAVIIIRYVFFKNICMYIYIYYKYIYNILFYILYNIIYYVLYIYVGV